MVQPASASKNLWVASSDGDLDRVRYLIEIQDLSPNAKDSNSYTPMCASPSHPLIPHGLIPRPLRHAAASYGHFELLEYLLSVGGDINVPDGDGETPLFTVESIETARWMLEHGSDPGLTNEEGLSAAEYLEEDHPEVAAYLSSLLPSPPPNGSAAQTGLQYPAISALAVDEFANRQTSGLLAETRRIMEESERDGSDPDPRLREAVERAVRDGFTFGGQVGDAVLDDGVDGDEDGRTRRRTNGD